MANVVRMEPSTDVLISYRIYWNFLYKGKC